MEPQEEQFSNQSFIQSLLDSPNGNVKKASAGATGYIRDHLRESAIFPNILPPTNVTYDDLDRIPGQELGVMIDEYEPSSPASRSVPFGGAADSVQFRGITFVTYFGKEITPEFTKLIDELAMYTMDLRQVVTDNALKDLDNRQDTIFFASVDAMVGSASGVGDSGLQQSFETNGQITRRSYKDALNNLIRMDVPNGVWVLAVETANEWVGMGREEWGGDMAQDVLLKGLSGAMSKLTMVGVPHIATIKRTVVPFNTVYQFSTPQFMGKHYILQGLQMFVERKDDLVRWYAHRKYGARIANVKCATKQRWV